MLCGPFSSFFNNNEKIGGNMKGRKIIIKLTFNDRGRKLLSAADATSVIPNGADSYLERDYSDEDKADVLADAYILRTCNTSDRNAGGSKSPISVRTASWDFIPGVTHEKAYDEAKNEAGRKAVVNHAKLKPSGNSLFDSNRAKVKSGGVQRCSR